MLIFKLMFWAATLYLGSGAGFKAVQAKRAICGDDADMPLVDFLWTLSGFLTAVGLVAGTVMILSFGHNL